MREREEWHRQKEQKKWDEVKAAAAIAQLSPSKAQSEPQPTLARALISQPTPTLLPTCQQLSGLAQGFQDEGIATNGLVSRQQEFQAKRAGAAMRKLTKREKEEQWRQSMEQGAFKTIAGRKQLIDSLSVLMERHQKRQTRSNQIVLG